jgi:prepilin-type N-terminal cleavage/methylation domain-containing protein
MSRAAFTLIETMLVLLILAILAAGMSIGFSSNLRAARAADGADLVKAFDAAARQMAVASGRPVRIEIDSAGGLLKRLDADQNTPAATVPLPAGMRIDRVRIGPENVAGGVARVDVSARGWSRRYAVRLAGPGGGRWVVFAGLSGSATEVSDESQLPSPPQTPGYDAP